MERPKEVFVRIRHDGEILGAERQPYALAGYYSESVRYVLPESWTYCRDRQPEKEGDFLVCVDDANGTRYIAIDEFFLGSIDSGWSMYGAQVYAYRPLPEPAEMPEEKK